MNILHVNTHDAEGGAAKIAWDLVALQRAGGRDAQMLVGSKRTSAGFVHTFDPEPDMALGDLCREGNFPYMHLQGSHRLVGSDHVRRSDVIHLHNLHYDFFNPFSIPALSRSMPTVWTLHDLYALTGFCNHPLDCEQWIEGCLDCEKHLINRINFNQTPVDPVRKSGIAESYRLKKMVFAYSPLHVVVPSDWGRRMTERSILGDHEISVIHNGVKTDVFCPMDRQEAREALGIPQGAPVIGAAAFGGVFNGPTKGGAETMAALEGLWTRYPDLIFLNVGAFTKSPHPNIVNVPYSKDEGDLVQAYSVMDVFFFTSLAETFGLVVAEAMACGLPVVTFDVGPLGEVVEDGETGYVVSVGKQSDLLSAVETLLSDCELRQRMGRAARERVVAKFSAEHMTRQYDRLYDQVVANHGANASEVQSLPVHAVPSFVRTPVFMQAEYGEGDGDAAFDGGAMVEDFLRERIEAGRTEYAGFLDHLQQYRSGLDLKDKAGLAYLREMVEARPDDIEMVRTVGGAHAVAGDCDEAVRLFRLCLERDPMVFDVWLNISDALRYAGKFEESLAALEEIPYMPKYHMKRGQVFEAKGHPRLAVMEYVKEYRLHREKEMREWIRNGLTRLGKPAFAKLLFPELA